MSKYYLMTGKNSRVMTIALAPEGTKLDHELIPDLEGKNQLPFEMKLMKITTGKSGLLKSTDLSGMNNIWLDYQINSLAWPIMSEKLKQVIENNLTGNEQIDWLTCIINCDNEKRNYFLLRFCKMVDVLDLQETVFCDEDTEYIIQPVFSLPKVKNFSIFSEPAAHNFWKITPGVYVSEKIKKVVEKEKLTGISFEKTRVTE